MPFPLPVPDEYQSNIQIRLRVIDSKGGFGIRNADLVSGKFYSDRGPDNNLAIETVNTKTFADDDITTVNACNKSSALFGTEGSFDIARSGEKVATVKWAIPLGNDGPPNTRERHGPVSRTKPTADVKRHRTEKDAYDLDVDGLKFAPWEDSHGHKFWEVKTYGTISLKIFRVSCLLKIHNALRGRIVVAKVTQHKDLSKPYDSTTAIMPGTTMDWRIGILDGTDGRLHLQFSYTSDPSHIFVPVADADYGTFKCDNLRLPSGDNAIGDPAKRIDVTSTTHNADNTESEIHIYVR